MYTQDDLFASRDYLVQTINQATATRDAAQDPDEWAETQDVIAAHTRLLAIVEHVILAENKKPRLEVPCGDVKIVAEVNPDENYHEIIVGFECPDGGWIQDLAIIRQRYHYDDLTVVFDEGAEVAVWSDANNEDFTDKFAIDIYRGENERRDVVSMKRNATIYTVQSLHHCFLSNDVWNENHGAYTNKDMAIQRAREVYTQMQDDYEKNIIKYSDETIYPDEERGRVMFFDDPIIGHFGFFFGKGTKDEQSHFVSVDAWPLIEESEF